MENDIPSAAAIRQALVGFSMRQLERLAELSGVPMTTIYKIKLGTTENPGIETVRQFAPHIAAAQNDTTQTAA
jgi:predicted transcriptional regulator